MPSISMADLPSAVSSHTSATIVASDVASRAHANPRRRRSATGWITMRSAPSGRNRSSGRSRSSAAGGRQHTQLKAGIDQHRVQRVLNGGLFEVFRKLDPCAREAFASLNLTKAAESRTEVRAQILEFGVDCIGGDRVCGNGV